MAVPEDIASDNFIASTHSAPYGPLRGINHWGVNYPKDGGPPIVSEGAFKGHHFIAFDGDRWRMGYCGGPNSFLDAEKYPAHIYSCEGIGNKAVGEAYPGTHQRATHWLHGYVSKDANLPEFLPQLDKSTLTALHEKNAGCLEGLATSYSPMP